MPRVFSQERPTKLVCLKETSLVEETRHRQQFFRQGVQAICLRLRKFRVTPTRLLSPYVGKRLPARYQGRIKLHGSGICGHSRVIKFHRPTDMAAFLKTPSVIWIDCLQPIQRLQRALLVSRIAQTHRQQVQSLIVLWIILN